MAGNNNKDPIERLFRKKADEYDISYREEDWQKLESKLDASDAYLAYRRKLTWLTAASLLIISALGYFTYDNYSRLNDLHQQLSEAEQEVMEVPEAFESQPGMDDLHELGERTGIPPAIDDPAGRIVPIETDPPALSGIAGVSEPELGTADTFTGDEVDLVPMRTSLPQLSLSAPTHETATLDPVDTITSPPESAADHSPTAVADVDMETTDESIRSRFSVGLVTSPDLSTAGSTSNFHTPGFKLGVTAEYNLTNNLAVYTGIVHSTVRYSDQSQQYTPPGYLNGGITPDEIVGECVILDIPITLKYDVLNFDQSRLFATAGLSSYIMLNEDYDFYYQNPEEEELVENWNDQTGTRHWFSNAGFSVGYEYDVHQNWSMRVEPFIRLPLQEVGWANVRLYSMGSFISINYRL